MHAGSTAVRVLSQRVIKNNLVIVTYNRYKHIHEIKTLKKKHDNIQQTLES